jgi:hypothetical protein
LTIYYQLDQAATSQNFNLWTDSDGCPTSWWISAMTDKSDNLKPSISYTPATRKVTIAKIAKDVNGKKVSASGGKYERSFTVKARTGGDDIGVNAKLTVYVFDPDCKTATATFNPTSIAKTYYLQGSAATSITLSTMTLANGSGCTTNVKTSMNLPTPADATITAPSGGKITYKASSKTANIGHFQLSIQYTHNDKAATNVSGGLIKAPVTVSTTACETGTDVGSCTTDGCSKNIDHKIGSDGVAGSAQQFNIFKLKAGLSGCLFDYSATTIPSAIKD